MNKGLFVHIIGSIIYVALVLFIVNGEHIGMGGRFFIVLFLLATNAVCVFINYPPSDRNWYKEII